MLAVACVPAFMVSVDALALTVAPASIEAPAGASGKVVDL